jgi:chromosome segregation ATPase
MISLKITISTLKGENAFLKNQSDAIQRLLVTSRQENATSCQEIVTLQENVAKITQEKATFQWDCRLLKQDCYSLQNQVAQLTQTVATKEREIVMLRDKVVERSDQLVNLKQSVKELIEIREQTLQESRLKQQPKIRPERISQSIDGTTSTTTTTTTTTTKRVPLRQLNRENIVPNVN